MNREATVLSIALWMSPALASAQIMTGCQFARLVSSFVNVFGYLVFVIGIASILYSALLFLISGGNTEKVATATRTFIYGLIGIAIALFSSYAVEFVQGIIGGSITNPC